MSPTLVVEPNVDGAKFKQVFSVLRLDQVDLLVRDTAEEPLDVYVFKGPTLAAHRELGRAFAVADRSDVHDPHEPTRLRPADIVWRSLSATRTTMVLRLEVKYRRFLSFMTVN
jgi:hypothetical protein